MSKDHGSSKTGINAKAMTEDKVKRMVQVSDIPQDITQEDLCLYLEHKKSGGGEAVCVSYDKINRSAVFLFRNVKDAESVCERRKHKFRNNEFKVTTYKPGTVSVDIDKLPIDCDERILPFLLNSPSLREDVEKQLKEHGCKIVWPSDGRTTIEVSLMPSSGDQDDMEWRRQCEPIVQETLSKVTYDDISTDADVFEDFKTEIKSVLKSYKKNVAAKFDNDKHVMKIVGLKEAVVDIKNRAGPLLNKLQKTKHKNKGDITEDKVALKNDYVVLLKKTGFINDLQKDFLDVKFSLIDNYIIFKGPCEMMKKARIAVLQKTENFCSQQLNCNPAVAKLLSESGIKRQMVLQFEQKGINATIEVADEVCRLHGTRRDVVRSAETLILECIGQATYEIEPDSAATTASDFEKFALMLKTKNPEFAYCISGNGLKLDMATLSQSSNNIFRSVMKFLSDHNVSTEFVTTDGDIIELVKRHLSEEMAAICKRFKDSIRINTVIDCEKPGLSISGPKAAVQEAAKEVQNLLRSVKRVSDKIRQPGLSTYLSTHEVALNAIEEKHSVIIKPDLPAACETTVADGDELSINGKAVLIEIGDLTTYTTDALVNAANKQLRHRGGLAKALVKAGGKDIQADCDTFISDHGPLESGQVFVSSAGQLRCKYLIHTVGPRWKGGQNLEETRLYRAVHAAAMEASRRGCVSLAIPSISTGVYSFPLNMATEITLRAIVDVLKGNTSLQKVYIVDQKQDVIDALKYARHSLLSDHNASSPAKKQRSTATATGANSAANHQVDEDPGTVTMRYLALSHDAIKSAQDELKKMCERKFHRKELDSMVIGQLTTADLTAIISLQSKFPVCISLIDKPKCKSLAIEGHEKAVRDVAEKISDILRAIEKEQQSKEMREITRKQKEMESDILASKVKWCYKDGPIFKEYDKVINAVIEKAFDSKQSYAEWIEPSKIKYRVTFSTLLEEQADGGGYKIPVVRRTDSVIPLHWEAMPERVTYKEIVLRPTDPEYAVVESNARSTDGGTIHSIVKITRVQNESLFKQYMTALSNMKQRNPSTTNERILWHGTSSGTVCKINSSGFNRSYCGKNATVYGNGVYFAKNFNYSASPTYSPSSKEGVKHVYQCRVLTGSFTVGHSGLIDTPVKDSATLEKYDSVVDSELSPGIFVVFTDWQAYPEYLVYFK